MLLIYIVTYLLEALIFSYYCENVFYSQKEKLNRVFVNLIIHLILLVVFLFCNTFISAACIILLYSLYIFYYYKAKIKAALFHSMLLCVVMAFSEYIVYMVLSLGHSQLLKDNTDIVFVIIYMAISKFFNFGLVFILRLYFDRDHNARRKSLSNFFIILVLIASVFVAVTFGIINLNYDISINHKILVLFVIIGSFLTNVVMVLFNEYLNKKTEEYHMLQLQYQKEHANIEYYKMADESYENMRIIKHDIKNHLIIVRERLETGDYENAKQYLAKIEKNMNKDVWNKYCEVHELNVLLNVYKDKFINNEINFCYDIRNGTLDSMESEDIVALFSNILSNMYEAINKNDSAKYVDLCVRIDASSGKTVISCTNSCSEEPRISSDGSYLSRKTDDGHGIGTRSIRKVVKKYKGEIQNCYDDEKKEFHTIILL